MIIASTIRKQIFKSFPIGFGRTNLLNSNQNANACKIKSFSTTNIQDEKPDVPSPPPKGVIDFGRGWPAQKLLPFRMLSNAMQNSSKELIDETSKDRLKMLDYGYPVEGETEFRISLSNYYHQRLFADKNKHELEYKQPNENQFFITGGM